jgi:DNA-binding Xre family transcriptional regulator
MKKKYQDCIRTDGMCGACSMSSYGRDCHNNRISGILYNRSIMDMTQRELAEKSGVNIRQIQKYESGEYDIGNMTLKNALALSKALECEVEDLL